MPSSLLTLLAVISFMCILFLSKSCLVEAPFILDLTVKNVIKPVPTVSEIKLVHIYRLTQLYICWDPEDWNTSFKVFESKSYLFSLNKRNFLFFKNDLNYFNFDRLSKLAIYDESTGEWLDEKMREEVQQEHFRKTL